MRYDIGMKVMGDWEIVAELGEGSFGKVFRLEKNTYKIKASSALKVLTVPRSTAEIEDAFLEGYDEQSVTEQFHEVVEKLVDEIAVMAELKSHPNIVSVEDYTVVQHEGAIGWDILIRMELLTPLQEYQRRHPMDENAARKLASDICQALVFCQTKHLIHRDIKPGNVFVDSLGHYKLGDFGVARTAEQTMSGMSKQGTENYMAPEVYYGREYGPNVDVYSLGIMLYRLMNKNRLPFYPLPPVFPKSWDREQSMSRRLKGEALPSPCDASDEFASIILKACEADPSKRYHTAEEMLIDLHRGSVQESVKETKRDTDSLEEFLKGKEITQEILTEIMSTRKLTPSEMVYLMSLLDSREAEEDDISFDVGGSAGAGFDKKGDFNEDSWDETVGTVGVFGGVYKKNIVAEKKEKKKTGGTTGLEQYLLMDVEESEWQDAVGIRSGSEQCDEWSEDSTDEMRDHAIAKEQDADEDATISVFRKNAKITQDAVSEKSKKKIEAQKVNGQNGTEKATVTDLADLGLTVRTYNRLKREGINTVEELCSMTLEDIRDINNVGPMARDEILTALGAHGFQLSTGKSKKQIWKENKSQWMMEYWKINLPRILREKDYANKQYFAPMIPEEIWTEAIFHMTEIHVKKFGQVITVSDGKLKPVKYKDIVAVVDLSMEKEPYCTRGMLMTADAIYLHFGGLGKESVHPVMISYKEFCSGWTMQSGGLLKARRSILYWTTRTSGNCRYDSVYSNFVDYEVLLECLKELSKKEK